MAKSIDGGERDVAGDVADAVGNAIGSIVNEIEQLDKRRDELVQQLQKAADSVNAQLSKWLPAGLAEMPSKVKDSYKRARKEAPCSVCRFKTAPSHDARSHRHQDPKKPFTGSELADRHLERLP